MLSFDVSKFLFAGAIPEVPLGPLLQYSVGDELVLTYAAAPGGCYITFGDCQEVYLGSGSGRLHFLKRTDCQLATIAANPKDLFFSVARDCCAAFKSMFTDSHLEGVLSVAQIAALNSELRPTLRNPLYTVHGVQKTAHLWFSTSDVDCRIVLKSVWSFEFYGSQPAPHSVVIDKEWDASLKYACLNSIAQVEYSKFETLTTELPSGSRVHRTSSGVIIDVSDRFCVFKAIAQFCEGSHDQWDEFSAMGTVMCDAHGAFPKAKISSLVSGLKITHIDFDISIIDGSRVLADSGTWYLMTDQTHAYAILPRKMRQNRAYIPLHLVIQRLVDFQENVVPILPSKDQPSQTTVRKNQGKGKQAQRFATQHMEKRIDHDKIYINKLVEQVSSLDLAQLTDFNFDEIQAWDSINLKFKYRRQLRWVPKYPELSITTIESLKTATSLFKNYFPKLFKRQDNVSNLMFEMPETGNALIAGREIDWVSKQAEQSLGAETLISLHQSQMVHIPKKQEKDVKKLMAGFLNIKATPAGIIPTEFLKCLVTYGIHIDQDMQRCMSSKSGGHASCRFPNDVLAAENLTRIINTKQDQVMMDLGAKFGCNGPLLRAATHFSGVDVRSNEDSDEYRMKYILKNLTEIFAEDALTRRQTYFRSELFNSEEAWIAMDGVPDSLKKSMLLHYRHTSLIRSTRLDVQELQQLNRLRSEVISDRQAIITGQAGWEDRQEHLRALESLSRMDADSKRKCGIIREDFTVWQAVSTFIQDVKRRPRQWYCPIRPDNTQYNQVYYAENMNKYSELVDQGIVCPGQIQCTPVFRGIVQDFDPRGRYSVDLLGDDAWDSFEQSVKWWFNGGDLEEDLILDLVGHMRLRQMQDLLNEDYAPVDEDERLVYQANLDAIALQRNARSRTQEVFVDRFAMFINDVHYYLGGFVPQFPCIMYVSGIDFHCFPGHYRLPCNEGSFTVWADDDYLAQVSMNTQGNSQIYSHPLVKVCDQTKRLDFGWTAFFSRIYIHSNQTNSIFEHVYMPVVDELKFPQANYIVKFHAVNAVKTDQFKSLSALQRQCVSQMYTEEQVQDILSRGFEKVQTSGGLLSKVASLVYRKNIRVDSDKLDSFVRHNNYSVMKNVTVGIEQTFLSFFTWRDEQAFSQNRLADDKWYLSWSSLRRSTVRTLDHQDLCQIMVAGRSDEVENKCLTSHLKSWDQISTKNAVKVFSITSSASEKIKSEPIVDGPERVYLAVKPIPGKIEHNPLTMDQADFSAASLNLNQWLINREPDTSNRKSPIVNSGYDILKQGEHVNSFEWSSKSDQNAYVALVGRQLNSQTRIDPIKLTRFQKVSLDYLIGLTNFMVQDEQLIRDLRTFNPLRWLDSKTTFDESKKSKYHKTIHTQMTSQDPKFISSFKTMVKNGEVQVTFDAIPSTGDFEGQDSRPRNISVPSQATCGFLTAIQSVFFPSIQRHDPGFVQACTKQELTSRMTHALREVRPTKSVSIDGSSFDSTQYAQLQSCVDGMFWNLIEPLLQDHLCKDAQYKPLSPVFIQNLIRDATQLVHTLFVKLPQAEEYRWTGSQRRAYRRDWPNSKDLKGDQFVKNYIPLTIQGTTFSGHPTATTLGNTLRSICYVLFYASEAGIPSSSYKYFVSGDDVVIYVADQYLDRFLHAMRDNTLTSNTPLAKGLGQIVKEINVRSWDDIEFCSKWSFSKGSYDSFGLTRDVQKALLTRQFYNGENALFRASPDAYVSALLEGFQSEHLSSLMEDIFRARLSGSFQAGLSKMFTYKFEEGGNYEWESEINQRLDIQLSTLYRIVLKNQVMISGREQTPGLNKLARHASGRQTTRQTQRVQTNKVRRQTYSTQSLSYGDIEIPTVCSYHILSRHHHLMQGFGEVNESSHFSD